MIETDMCDYRTPCGWCSKWDKKCDKKIGAVAKPEENKSVDGLTPDIGRNELVIKYQKSLQEEAATGVLESASPLTNKV